MCHFDLSGSCGELNLNIGLYTFSTTLILLPPNFAIIICFSLLNKVPRMFFPILWFEQRVTTPAETLSLLKILVILPTAGFVTSLILMTAGTILLLIFGKIRWNKNRKTLVISSCGYVTILILFLLYQKKKVKSRYDPSLWWNWYFSHN